MSSFIRTQMTNIIQFFPREQSEGSHLINRALLARNPHALIGKCDYSDIPFPGLASTGIKNDVGIVSF